MAHPIEPSPDHDPRAEKKRNAGRACRDERSGTDDPKHGDALGPTFCVFGRVGRRSRHARLFRRTGHRRSRQTRCQAGYVFGGFRWSTTSKSNSTTANQVEVMRPGSQTRLSEIPWEYLLSAATRNAGRFEFRLVTRCLRNGAAMSSTRPRQVLFVESAPGRMTQEYEFVDEEKRIRAASIATAKGKGAWSGREDIAVERVEGDGRQPRLGRDPCFRCRYTSRRLAHRRLLRCGRQKSGRDRRFRSSARWHDLRGEIRSELPSATTTWLPFCWQIETAASRYA